MEIVDVKKYQYFRFPLRNETVLKYRVKTAIGRNIGEYYYTTPNKTILREIKK